MADNNILSVTLIGAEKLAKSIQSTSEFAKNELAKAINKAAVEADKQAVTGAPHLHGGLRSSIHVEKATPNNLVAKVGTNLVYARAQEYGTQGMTIHSHSKLGKAFTYIGNIKPKYYMRNAREYIRPKLHTYLQEASRRIVSHIATGS